MIGKLFGPEKMREGISPKEGREITESPRTPFSTKLDMETIKTRSLESVEQSNLEYRRDNPECRALSDAEKKALQLENGLPEKLLDLIRVDEKGNYVVDCINKELAGKNHEKTNVHYAEKTIEINGIQIKVVVPEFSPVVSIDVPKELWEAGDDKVFGYCMKQLKEYLDAHPDCQKEFSTDQLGFIRKYYDGKLGNPRIPGFTWHHSEIPGRMELVDSTIHAASGHTGGDALWCNGIR